MDIVSGERPVRLALGRESRTPNDNGAGIMPTPLSYWSGREDLRGTSLYPALRAMLRMSQIVPDDLVNLGFGSISPPLSQKQMAFTRTRTVMRNGPRNTCRLPNVH